MSDFSSGLKDSLLANMFKKDDPMDRVVDVAIIGQAANLIQNVDTHKGVCNICANAVGLDKYCESGKIAARLDALAIKVLEKNR